MKQEKHKISDAVAIGSWEEVENLELNTLTKSDADIERLNGLIVRGYETKFGVTNTNGERYDKEAIDDFIERYFVKQKLNMPVTLLHKDDIEHLCGRVLIVEVNSVGYYFVAYIPRTYMHYDAVKSLLKEGVLQGFSKEGWATDCEFVTDNDGNEYCNIKKIDITNISLVATPANGIGLEKMSETKIKDTTHLIKEETPRPKKKWK